MASASSGWVRPAEARFRCAALSAARLRPGAARPDGRHAAGTGTGLVAVLRRPYGFFFNHWRAGRQSANCRGSQRGACTRGAGQVARSTFSGPRSRGTVFGSQALRHQHRLFVRWSRPPRMGPATVPQATCPGHPGRMRRRGMHPRRHQGGGGAPGCRPDSRSPPMVAGHSGDDAAARCRQSRPPASVGRRTGAPPPPCRHDVGMLTWRGQTTVGRLHPPNLVSCMRVRRRRSDVPGFAPSPGKRALPRGP